MCVQDAADITRSWYIAVCIATTGLGWAEGHPREGSSSATRTTADRAWLRSDGPAVKYISSAPGPEAHIPVPLAEIARLRQRAGDFDYLIDQVLVHDALPQALTAQTTQNQTLPVKQI